MLTKRIVLILGAGSNCHLGYPLGSRLVDAVCTRIREKRYDPEIAGAFPSEQIEMLGVRLSRSQFGSIDAFLEQNRDDLTLRTAPDC